MKTIKAVITILLACTTLSNMAQVNFSALPIDTVNGKVVYRYTVKKSEGLYRISKNFGVSQEEIVNYNPILQTRGLREKQVINIPVVQRMDMSKYILHEIQPKETLYGLGKRYGVTVEELQALNPQVSKNMPIGAKLLVPKPSQQSSQQPSQQPSQRPSQQPSQQPAQSVEPRVKQTLELEAPRATHQPKLDLTEIFQGKTSSQAAVQPVDSLVDTLLTEVPQRVLRIAFLLPFMTDEAKRTPATERFVEFYEGALLAINQAQEEGQKMEIYVFDTQKNDVRIQTILQQDTLKMLDAIVGPAYPSQVGYVSKFAAENQIPTLIPFTSKVEEITTNPYLLQFNPSDAQMQDTLIAHLAGSLVEPNYVFIETDGKRDAASVNTLKQQLKAKQIAYKEVTDSLVMNDLLAQELHATQTNIIVFDTDKYRDIGLLLAKVEQLQQAFPMLLWAQYAWQNNPINMPYVYASIFKRSKLIDIDLMTYTMRFNHFFGHDIQNDAPRYDLLGYDLTTWLILWLQSDKKIHTLQGLQSDINFQAINAQSGYVNTSIQIIRP